MTPKEALSIVFGGHAHNFVTGVPGDPAPFPGSYAEWRAKLRRADQAKDKQVERALEPLLARIYPRRQREWHQTSRGTAMRLQLLSQNRHLQQDAEGARRFLRIPDGQIQATPSHPLWAEAKTRVKPEFVKQAVEHELACRWIMLHRDAALRRPTEAEAEQEARGLLGDATANCAIRSGSQTFAGEEVPDWLRKPPTLPPPYNHPDIPLDWIAGRLIERHRLPASTNVEYALLFFVLTLDPSFLEPASKSPLRITESRDGDPLTGDDEAFSVTISGIDEYVTKEEWTAMWDAGLMSTRRDVLWQRRGGRPSGKRSPSLATLQAALPAYNKMVETGGSAAEAIRTSDVDLEESQVRNTIKDLGILLRPAD